MIWLVLVGTACALLGYIRLAPADVATWHKADPAVTEAGEYLGTGRFTGQYRVEDAPAALARLHEVALATPRTQVLAGSLATGRITYVTRSRLIGFPDYTTVSLADDEQALQLFARLRFGLDDMGVNKARVRDWVRRADIGD